MHDIRAIRENRDAFDAALSRRGGEYSNGNAFAKAIALDTGRRAAISKAEEAASERKRLSKEAGDARARRDMEVFEELRRQANARKEDDDRFRRIASERDKELTDYLLTLPNIPDDDVPVGDDEDDNVELRRWGTPRDFAFAPKEHYEIPGVVPGMDFETAARMSGSRFVMLRGAVARVHRALAQFMLDTHTQANGYTEHMTPVLVREEAMTGVGQLPKFWEDSYQTREGMWLIPTSEVTLTYSVADEILAEADLPRRMTAHTLCFRSEAGSAGRDTAGMLRQHQFEKVEMVSVTHPDRSRKELDRMTRCAEGILEALGLPYRTMLLCTGDMGFGARRTHDIEVWLPGQGTYREISSCSTTGDFQARRMNARFRPEGGGKPEFVHTLNGSGLAVGRCLIAVLENGQEADGSVTLPEALRPWLGGLGRITAEGALA